MQMELTGDHWFNDHVLNWITLQWTLGYIYFF